MVNPKPRGARRLLASLLPSTWPDRAGVLDAACRLDARHGGNASGELLRAWSTWRRSGELPACAALAELLQQLGVLCGGVAFELRSCARRSTSSSSRTPFGNLPRAPRRRFAAGPMQQ